MALLQALLDQRAQDDLEADGKPQLRRRASRQYTRSIEHVGRQYQEDLRPGVVHTGSPRCHARGHAVCSITCHVRARQLRRGMGGTCGPPGDPPPDVTAAVSRFGVRPRTCDAESVAVAPAHVTHPLLAPRAGECAIAPETGDRARARRPRVAGTVVNVRDGLDHAIRQPTERPLRLVVLACGHRHRGPPRRTVRRTGSWPAPGAPDPARRAGAAPGSGARVANSEVVIGRAGSSGHA